MENSVRFIAIISLIVIGFVFLSPLSVNLKQAQAQQQASTGRNNTAAELARDPGDLFLRDKATPAEELKRDPGDLLLNITVDELARDPGDMLVKEKATPSEELKKDPGDLILTGPK
jgi:hypothetical protein